MAHENIFQRRAEVLKILKEKGDLTRKERHEIAKRFNCTYAAIYSDMTFLKRDKSDKRPVFANPALKARVFKRDNFECQYCGATDRKLIAEHVIPYFDGGVGKDYNIVAACESCNCLKKGRTKIPKNIEVLRSLNPDWADLIIEKANKHVGRPQKFNEPTKTISFRVPESKADIYREQFLEILQQKKQQS